MSEEQIIAWAQEHRDRTGSWPTDDSGPIPGTRGEVWANVNAALRKGNRGLPGGSSLRLLLMERRGLRRKANGREP